MGGFYQHGLLAQLHNKDKSNIMFLHYFIKTDQTQLCTQTLLHLRPDLRSALTCTSLQFELFSNFSWWISLRLFLDFCEASLSKTSATKESDARLMTPIRCKFAPFAPQHLLQTSFVKSSRTSERWNQKSCPQSEIKHSWWRITSVMSN